VLSYLQAAILGLVQGATELFPISSLGHTVILPAWFGWHNVTAAQHAKGSYWLAFVVALHVGTAVALLWYFWRDWVRIIGAWFSSIAKRRIEGPDERLAWLLVVATIPAGLTGLAFEHLFRILFAKPLAAGCFFVVNGIVLLIGDRARVRAEHRARAHRQAVPVGMAPSRALSNLELKESGVIGVAQVFALLAGISRSGITMVAGLLRGLNYEDAARFSFLLATPIIFAAGLYKLPLLLGPRGADIRGQALVGAVVAGIAAYLSTRWLMRYFETNKLWPFALYSLAFGIAAVVYFA